jgi:hypothetical protein
VSARYFRRAVATAAALCLCLTACGDGAAKPAGGAQDPSDAEVRAFAAAYLATTRSEVASLTIKDHHVGLYVRGTPDWSLDTYVTQLPLAAETSRAMLLRWPALNDVDVCGDAPWKTHAAGVTFVPGVQVHLYRDRLRALPARITAPGEVIRESLRVVSGEDHALDMFLDAKVREESAAYQVAYKAAGTKS